MPTRTNLWLIAHNYVVATSFHARPTLCREPAHPITCPPPARLQLRVVIKCNGHRMNRPQGAVPVDAISEKVFLSFFGFASPDVLGCTELQIHG